MSFHENMAQHIPPAGFNGATEGLLRTAATWGAFLRNKAAVQEALGEIADSFAAELVVLSRISRRLDGDDHLAIHDASSSKSQVIPLDRSFARTLFRGCEGVPKPGSIWLKSMLSDDTESALAHFHRCRNLRELVVIPLEVNREWLDCVEIHLPADLTAQQDFCLNLVAGVLAKGWRTRVSGVATETALHFKSTANKPSRDTSLLSAENPARLSRAEYRVCLLLSCGKTLEKAKEELGVTMSTVKAHLKNIYAKTNTNCQTELLCRLLR